MAKTQILSLNSGQTLNLIQNQGLIFNFSTQGGSASGGHFSIFNLHQRRISLWLKFTFYQWNNFLSTSWRIKQKIILKRIKNEN